ncbi:MAG: hypothetical protein MPK06_01455 [Alphaproteobacteria bacterium]|nr:hypothetical protein [Alphaproteobacteria bacterium]MDA8005197.1 hypothetical protein [Alphaproteobacteria bacterium]MDA8012819.1 hypothetical protein [Alphaproteobacteria bacterium]
MPVSLDDGVVGGVDGGQSEELCVCGCCGRSDCDGERGGGGEAGAEGDIEGADFFD